MNWKEKLAEIECHFGHHEKRDWRPTIELVQRFRMEQLSNVELRIRIIYLLHNILVEEEYTQEEHDLIASLLKLEFAESYQKFSDNSEYLFFIGKILYVAEWYFGIDDDTKPLEDKFAFKMQKKAFEKEPHNKLYEWAFLFSKNDKEKSFLLAKQLLYSDASWLNWLKVKGFPGLYIIEALKYCYENYK
ncbi:hypothetical protein [Pontibacter fetidus]|uniref:Uncharacterized protein n=1 Tax=Pontibacter fetidus TaxID=2700082 RepID=A0A6B2HAK0_9BACT|nr:hypothetical protein [Pontibacter fetidus]NDK57360.1 hypothetical protein [Pontibacter fetidus]